MNNIKEFRMTKKETIENSFVFIKEPVVNIIDKINNSKNKNIILSGNFDSGKRITSMQYMSDKLFDNELVIYFNSILLKEYELAKQNGKLESYIEFKIASKLLSYIKSMGITISPITLKFDLNNQFKSFDINLLRNYKCGDLVCPLLYIIRKATGIENVQLILNNIDGLSEDIQKQYSYYFDIFYKTILLINDKEIYNKKKYQEKYMESGYDVIFVDYAKDYDFSRRIIDSRIEFHNKNNPKDKLKTILNMVHEEDFKKFIDSADGNIRYILCAMKEFYLSDFDPMGIKCTEYIHNKTEQCKSLKYRNLYPTKKLYL